jgi:hypothetical protein
MIYDVMQPYKRYPRLSFRQGRLRVGIKNEDGTFCNEEIQSSMLHF